MASNPRQAPDVSLDYLSFSDTSRPEESVCISRPNTAAASRGAPACFPLSKPAVLSSLSPRLNHPEKTDVPSTTSPLSSANSSPATEASNFWDTAYSDEGVLSSHSIESFPTSPTIASAEGGYSSGQVTKGVKPEQQDNSFAFGPFDDWMGWNELSVNPLDPLSPVIKSEPFPKTEPRSPGRSNFQPPQASSFNPEFLDENSVAFQDTLNEEPLFQTPAQAMDSPQPPSRLYSTPLSWERPQPGYQNMPSRQYSNLTPAEESQLLSIAMPRLAPAYSHSLSPSPEPHQSNRRKRKSSTSSMSSSEDGERVDDLTVTSSSTSTKATSTPTTRHPPPKKTAHNMIEKRYRTNLNDKIAALRDSVPSLRVAAQKSEENNNEDLQGLAPAHKLNKATVLSKATEYIAHLEKRNRHLSKENANLKQRIEAFEILLQQNPNLGAAANMRMTATNNDGRERPVMSRVGSTDGSMGMQDKRSRYQ